MTMGSVRRVILVEMICCFHFAMFLNLMIKEISGYRNYHFPLLEKDFILHLLDSLPLFILFYFFGF